MHRRLRKIRTEGPRPSDRRFNVARLTALFHPANRVTHQFLRGIEAKLLLDVGAVGFDGFHADVQALCHRSGAQGATNEGENLQFAVREPRLGQTRVLPE